MITLRSLRKSDIPSIQKLALKSWLFTYRAIYSKSRIHREVSQFYADKKFKECLSQIKQNRQAFVVATDKNKIIGYAHIGKKEGKWELFRIYVSRKRLRKGIGSGLLNRIEKFVSEIKEKKYIVFSHSKNTIAKGFYEKSGFRRNKSKDRAKTSICFQKIIR